MKESHVPIVAPPWTRLGKKLESGCRKALFDFALLSGVSHLAVALSGGKDSLTLLFLLKAILGRGFPKIPLTAIHIDGAFSCGAGVQRSFLEKICTALEIPLLIKTSSIKRQEDLRCYPCARERRRLIFTAAKEANIATIAFGHHREDSVETLLLNLLHKGEFAANLPKVPMHDYGVTIIRPLLYLCEEWILSFAKSYGFARITCQCPVGQTAKRRQVKTLLTQMEALFPHAATNLALAGLHYGSKKALRN